MNEDLKKQIIEYAIKLNTSNLSPAILSNKPWAIWDLQAFPVQINIIFFFANIDQNKKVKSINVNTVM